MSKDSFFQQLSEKFNALDNSIEMPPEEIHKGLWIPAVALVVLGVAFICYNMWWLPVVAILGVFFWNVIATLSFKEPPLIIPPKISQENVTFTFHTIAKSKRVLFLLVPFGLLALVQAFETAMVSWVVALVLLWPLKFLLHFSQKALNKEFESDYAALCVACVLGFTFFWMYSSSEELKAKVGNLREQAKKVKSKIDDSVKKSDTEEKSSQNGEISGVAVKKLEQQVTTVEQGLSKRISALEQANTKLGSLTKLAEKFTDLETENKNLKTSLQNLQQRMESQIAILKQSSGSGNKKLKDRITQLEGSNDLLQSEVKVLSAKNKQLTRQLSDKETEASNLRLVASNNQQMQLRQKEENANLQRDINRLKKENETLKLMEKTYNLMQTDRSATEAQLRAQKELNEVLREDKQKLADENKKFEDKILEFETEGNSVKFKLQMLEIENNRNKEERTNLEEQVKLLEEKIAKLEAEKNE